MPSAVSEKQHRNHLAKIWVVKLSFLLLFFHLFLRVRLDSKQKCGCSFGCLKQRVSSSSLDVLERPSEPTLDHTFALLAVRCFLDA